MKEYELVYEIQNLCPHNQMRDIFFEEIESNNREIWPRWFVRHTHSDKSKTDNLYLLQLIERRICQWNKKQK